MPMFHGCYFSRREMKKDHDFLESQGLSEMQITAVGKYFRKRLCTNATLVGIGTCVLVYFTYLGFMAWDIVAK